MAYPRADAGDQWDFSPSVSLISTLRPFFFLLCVLRSSFTLPSVRSPSNAPSSHSTPRAAQFTAHGIDTHAEN